MHFMNARLPALLSRLLEPTSAGILALAAFGFLAPQGHAGAKFGLLCLLVASLTCWRPMLRWLKRDPYFYLVCLLTGYVFAVAGIAAHAHPELALQQWETAVELGLIGFYVLPVSWWLGGQPQRVALLGVAALLGLCIEIMVDVRIADLEGILETSERNMIGSALPTALVGGLALLALLFGAPALIAWASRRSRIMVAAVSVLGGIMLVLFVGLLAVTASRVILGMLALLIPLLLLVQLVRGHDDARKRRATITVGAGTMLAFCVALLAVGPTLIDKLNRELNQVIPYVSEGRISEMPPSSLGWRVQLSVLGAELVAERPWIGWGPGTESTRHLAEQFDREQLVFLHHLHNTFLEIWARLGIVGLLLYLTMILLLAGSAWTGWRQRRMPVEIGLFLMAGAILMAGFSLVDFRLLEWDFLFPFIVLAAVAHTFGLRWTESGSASPETGSFDRNYFATRST